MSEILPTESLSTSSESTSNIQTGSRWWIVLLVGVLGLAGGGLIWGIVRRGEAQTPPEVQATAVATETVQLSPIRVSSEFVGALEAQERVMLRPEVEGRIIQIQAEEGDRVLAGTPLLQLSPDRSQAVVRGAEADVDVALASQNAAEAEVLEAEAARDTARAEEVLQDAEYTRTETLVAQGALPQQSLDRVARDRDAAIAALTAAERRVEAAVANLGESEAVLRRAESSVAVASEDLSDYQITAPIDGIVGDLPVKIGDYVSIGELITTLTRNQTMDLRLSIPVERSDDLRPGLPVELRTEAGTEPLVNGSISFVAERVDGAAQSILAKATFPNPGGVLRDEQFVRANVVWTEERGVLVPTVAISRVGNQSFVFVMEPSEDTDAEFVAVQRPVQLGVIEGSQYQVLSGLEAGETIITSGILRLSDGAPVAPE